MKVDRVIPLFDMGGGREASDISAFAGGMAELKFSTTTYLGGGFYFDDVRFSAVPEPGIWALWVCGGLALWGWRSGNIWHRRRRSTSRHERH